MKAPSTCPWLTAEAPTPTPMEIPMKGIGSWTADMAEAWSVSWTALGSKASTRRATSKAKASSTSERASQPTEGSGCRMGCKGKACTYGRMAGTTKAPLGRARRMGVGAWCGLIRRGTKASTAKTRRRGMGCTSGRIAGSTEGGGIKISNMVLEYTKILRKLNRIKYRLSMDCGKWANNSYGFQMSKFNRYKISSLTIHSSLSQANPRTLKMMS